MEKPTSGRRSAFNEIDLIEVSRDIWGAKYFIVAMALAGFVFAIVTLAFAKPSYTAIMTVSQSEGAPRAGGGLGQYAAAAGALGINLGGGNDDTKFTKFKVLLDSDLLAGSLFKRDDLKPFFFGPGWHPQTRTFSRPTGISFEVKELVKGILGLHTWSTPGVTEVRASLKSQLSFTSDKLTGLMKISVQGENPRDAVFLLNTVVHQADALIRDAAKERAASRMRYLDRSLANTTMQDQREVMINIYSSQQRDMMMASVDTTFAIDILDPASASSIPTSPVPRVTLVTYVLTMGVIGVFIAVFFGWRTRRKTGSAATLDSQLKSRIFSRWASSIR